RVRAPSAITSSKGNPCGTQRNSRRSWQQAWRTLRRGGVLRRAEGIADERPETLGDHPAQRAQRTIVALVDRGGTVVDADAGDLERVSETLDASIGAHEETQRRLVMGATQDVSVLDGVRQVTENLLNT